ETDEGFDSAQFDIHVSAGGAESEIPVEEFHLPVPSGSCGTRGRTTRNRQAFPLRPNPRSSRVCACALLLRRRRSKATAADVAFLPAFASPGTQTLLRRLFSGPSWRLAARVHGGAPGQLHLRREGVQRNSAAGWVSGPCFRLIAHKPDYARLRFARFLWTPPYFVWFITL